MELPTSTLKDILNDQMGGDSLESCWMQGYQFGQGEGDESKNPFKKGSLENEHWKDGWWAGFYNEPALYSLDVLETQGDEAELIREQPIRAKQPKGINKLHALWYSLGIAVGTVALFSSDLLEMAA